MGIPWPWRLILQAFPRLAGKGVGFLLLFFGKKEFLMCHRRNVVKQEDKPKRIAFSYDNGFKVKQIAFK